MQSKHLRVVWIILLLFAFTLGCGLFSGIGGQIDEAKETAMALATDAQQGYSLLATARAIATVAGSSGLVETAQALATTVGDSGLLATAQAFATEQGPELMATAQAALTQAAPILGEAPTDIPLLGGELDALVTSEYFISYATQTSFQDVVNFYQRVMPQNGWNVGEEQSFANSMSIVEYEKPDRTATVTVTANPIDNNTMVVIAIQPR